jgi:hypothetical protein
MTNSTTLGEMHASLTTGSATAVLMTACTHTARLTAKKKMKEKMEGRLLGLSYRLVITGSAAASWMTGDESKQL